MDASTLRMTWYGDDFTGSTDTMEALTLAGIPSRLFLDVPDKTERDQLSGIEALGIAGNTRAMSPENLEHTLTPVLRGLKQLEAPICHYKVCSTFDSSPEIGSIGRAIEIGQRIFQNRPIPLLVGAPALGRYSLFGNLFARSGRESEVFRLDRHPTMRHHPVTPMDESDQRIHLGRQTSLRVSQMDILDIRANDIHVRLEQRRHEVDPDVLLFDVLEDCDFAPIGGVIESLQAEAGQIFTAGSSGIEYALTARWRANGVLPGTRPQFRIDEVGQTVIVSGSCSPVTARQIEAALNMGFAEIPINPERIIDEQCRDSEIHRAVGAARQELATGKSVILHTCLGPGDPRRTAVASMLEARGWSPLEVRLQSGKILGNALGLILRASLDGTEIQRGMVVGGDTSYHVARALGIRSLDMVAPTAPGSPLCLARAPGSPVDGMEIVFKGGQVGGTAFFDSVRRGLSGS
jgi:3-oxoisoapionate kinase